MFYEKWIQKPDFSALFNQQSWFFGKKSRIAGVFHWFSVQNIPRLNHTVLTIGGFTLGHKLLLSNTVPNHDCGQRSQTSKIVFIPYWVCLRPKYILRHALLHFNGLHLTTINKIKKHVNSSNCQVVLKGMFLAVPVPFS